MYHWIISNGIQSSLGYWQRNLNMIRCLASCKYLRCVVHPHGCPCGWQSPNMVNVAPTSAMYSTRVLYVPMHVSCMRITFLRMEKSSMPTCLRLFGHAKLLWHAGVGVVETSGKVEVLGVGSLQLIFQCIEGRGQCELRHANEGRGDVGGCNCDQGRGDWEANFKD